MKSNEIRNMLRGKVDPGVIQILEAYAEDQAAVKEAIQHLGNMLNVTLDMIMVHARILGDNLEPIENMKRAMEREKRSKEVVMSEPVMGLEEDISKS